MKNIVINKSKRNITMTPFEIYLIGQADALAGLFKFSIFISVILCVICGAAWFICLADEDYKHSKKGMMIHTALSVVCILMLFTSALAKTAMPSSKTLAAIYKREIWLGCNENVREVSVSTDEGDRSCLVPDNEKSFGEGIRFIYMLLAEVPSLFHVEISIIIDQKEFSRTEVVKDHISDLRDLYDALHISEEYTIPDKPVTIRLNGKESEEFKMSFTKTESHQYIDIEGVSNKGNGG